jgi:hypothetical protein
MLPEDTKQRKSVVLDKGRQSSVTEHFGPEDVHARPIAYSDNAFKAAAHEWLVETNQVRAVINIFISESPY